MVLSGDFITTFFIFIFMEEKEYVKKESSIVDLFFSKQDKVYSKTKIYTPLGVTPEILLSKDFILELANMVEIEGKVQYLEAIFKNKSGFYIYLSKKDISEISYKITVYFDSEKINEAIFFIKNLIKLKDGN
jgi:hypothetical protein